MSNLTIQTKPNNNSPKFGSGFRQVETMAKNLDIGRVSAHMQKLGIENNFEGNKIVAACSALTTNIFLKLGFKPPTGVFVTPFKKLSSDLNNALGFCMPDTSQYCAPQLEKLYGRRFNIRSVFFNSDINWNNLQKDVDLGRATNHASTAHPLHTFLHEFVHNVHIDHIYKKFGFSKPNNLGYKSGNGEQILARLQGMPLVTHKQAVKTTVSDYGTKDPIELVAENMTDLIVDSLNPYSLRPQKNPFTFSAFLNGKTVDEIFKRAWHGCLGAY